MDDRFFDPVILYRQGCLGESHANAFFWLFEGVDLC
jgi:hypothetical protein